MVALVHFRSEINCCAELHLGKENCVKSFKNGTQYRETSVTHCKKKCKKKRKPPTSKR